MYRLLLGTLLATFAAAQESTRPPPLGPLRLQSGMSGPGQLPGGSPDASGKRSGTGPRIVSQSSDTTVIPGGVLTLQVEVEGAPPLDFQWFFNGHPISGEKRAVLVLKDIDDRAAGAYQVTVSNRFGQIDSDPILVQLNSQAKESAAFVWVARLDNVVPGPHDANALVTDSRDNIYVAGRAVNRQGDIDGLVISYGPDGTQRWILENDFSNGGDDVIQAIALDPEENLIVGGTAMVFRERSLRVPRLVLAKVSDSGDVVWSTELSGPGIPASSETVNLVVGRQGDIYVLGNRIDDRETGILLACFDQDGRLRWERELEGERADAAAGLALEGDQSVIVTGTSALAAADDDIVVAKYDVAGDLIWRRRFNGPANGKDRAVDVAVNEAGEIYVGGAASNPGSGSDFVALKFSPGGALLWRRFIAGPGPAEDVPVGLALDPEGALILAGHSRAGEGANDLLLTKVSASGAIAWVVRRAGKSLDQVRDLMVDPRGAILLAGARTIGKSGQDFVTTKFDGDGNLLWDLSFPNPGLIRETAAALALDSAGDVIVTGQSLLSDDDPEGGKPLNTQITTIKETIVPPRANQLPKIVLLRPDSGSRVESGSDVTLLARASDKDGSIVAVEFLAGSELVKRLEDPPFRAIWTPTVPGKQLLVAKAFDDGGAVAISEPVEVDISPRPDGPPFIQSMTGDVTAPLASEVVLEADVVGARPLSFQWFFNGQPLREANERTLKIANLRIDNAGAYVLGVKNPLGQIRSEPVLVTIDAPVVVAGDNLRDRLPLIGDNGLIQANNTAATREIGEPFHAGKRGNTSVWFSLVFEDAGLAVVETAGSSFDTLLAVYTGSGFADLNEVASNDDVAGLKTSGVRFNVVAGQEYLVAVDGFNGQGGNLILSHSLDRRFLDSVPTVEVKPASQTARIGGRVEFRAILSTRSGKNRFQWFQNGRPIAGATQSVLVIEPVGLESIGAYTVEVKVGGRSVSSGEARLEVASLPLVTQIQPPQAEQTTTDKFADLFFGVFGSGSSLPVSLQARPRPTSASVATGFSGTQIFNTFGATKEADEPDHCGIVGGASQWFAYQAPAGGPLILSTEGSDFDTVLAVYVANGSQFSDLLEVACDNDSGADGKDSRVRFEAQAGTIYFCAVDGVGGASGLVRLSFRLDLPLSIDNARLIGTETLEMRVQSVPSLDFTIEVSPDLLFWAPILTTNSLTGRWVFRDKKILSRPLRFFRVRYSQ